MVEGIQLADQPGDHTTLIGERRAPVGGAPADLAAQRLVLLNRGQQRSRRPHVAQPAPLLVGELRSQVNLVD